MNRVTNASAITLRELFRRTAASRSDTEAVIDPPTGRSVEVAGELGHRVEDGKLTDGKGAWIAFGLLERIGALPG